MVSKTRNKTHKNFYIENQEYSKFIDKLDVISYSKYIEKIESLDLHGKYFLDVGCGTGKVITKLNKNIKTFGLEVSRSHIKLAKKNRTENFILFDGEKFPFKRSSFDCCGSFTVLEHVEKPKLFINEVLKIVKNQGYIIIVCPNFLALSNSYHHSTKGFFRKIENFLITISKIFRYSILRKELSFDSMKPIKNKQFKPDDDAITKTNPIDIIYFLRKNNVKIIYYSSTIYENSNKIFQFLKDIPFIKLFFGGVFIIGKNELGGNLC